MTFKINDGFLSNGSILFLVIFFFFSKFSSPSLYTLFDAVSRCNDPVLVDYRSTAEMIVVRTAQRNHVRICIIRSIVRNREARSIWAEENDFVKAIDLILEPSF